MISITPINGLISLEFFNSSPYLKKYNKTHLTAFELDWQYIQHNSLQCASIVQSVDGTINELLRKKLLSANTRSCIRNHTINLIKYHNKRRNSQFLKIDITKIYIYK